MPLTKTDKAYIAGLLDGEGSISLVKSFAKRTNGRYVYPYIRIANTDKVMIDWLRSKLSNGYRGYHSKLHEGCKDVHHLAWASNEAIELLRMVRPYLVSKAQRADIVLRLSDENRKYLKLAGGYFGNGHPLPDELMEKRRVAFDLLQKLNKRGIENVTSN